MFVRILVLALTIALMSGCSLYRLKSDLEDIKAELVKLKGEIVAKGDQNSSVILVITTDNLGKEIRGFRFIEKPGSFEFMVESKPMYLFAFSDINRDLRHQPTEPYGWHRLDKPLILKSDVTNNIRINLLDAAINKQPIPLELRQQKAVDLSKIGGMPISVGTVRSLDDPLLSDEQGVKGMWQPFEFIKDGGAGIHFLEPYDPKKIPVLFVHGIGGSPQNFRYIINHLDRSKYQAWFFSYPSGYRLKSLANGLFGFVNGLHHKMDFKRIHVVAHSMGGLVTRGYLNLCAQQNRCFYLLSYTTISTPWGGHDSAKTGVAVSPVVMPVWHDMAPGSEYLTALFDTPLPHQIPHYLLFGFKRSGILGGKSSDGTITLSSQLDYSAQDQSSEILGYDEDHVSILGSDRVIEKLHNIFQSNGD